MDGADDPPPPLEASEKDVVYVEPPLQAAEGGMSDVEPPLEAALFLVLVMLHGGGSVQRVLMDG